MPSQKPRMNLTLDEDLNELLTDLSVLMNVPRTRIVTDFLNEIKPTLLDLRDALQLAEQKKSAIPQLARLAANINTQTATINNEMSDLLKQYSLLEGASND